MIIVLASLSALRPASFRPESSDEGPSLSVMVSVSSRGLHPGGNDTRLMSGRDRNCNG